MDGRADEEDEPAVSLPGSLAAGAVLVAGPTDPAEDGLCLRALCAYRSPDDEALVVTTTEGADETRSRFEAVCPNVGGRPLAVVDTVSRREYLPSLYTEEPTVFTSSPGDLERIVLALSDLTRGGHPSSGGRHFVVRSLTPMLAAAPVERVPPVVERIAGLRTDDGYGFLGLDFTAHDEETVAELVACVDGVLWFSTADDGTVEFELRSTRASSTRS